MAADPRARLSFESYPSVADSQFSYRAISPSDFSTPTSATFSTGQNSPRWGSGMASPSGHSRTQSLYAPGSRTPGRRLSVPSGAGNPFQSPHGAPPVGRPLFGPGSLNPSNAAAHSSNGGSLLSSPTASTSGWSIRRDSISSSNEEAWRRRTWHPDTREYSAGGSRLSNVITPSQFPTTTTSLPIADPAAQQTNLRLPGIESFDPLPHRSGSPLRRPPSPMAVDSEPPSRAHRVPSVDSSMEDRRGVPQWDMGLHRGLTRLDIASPPPPRDSLASWAEETNQALLAQAEQVRPNPPTVRFEPEPHIVHIPSSQSHHVGMSRGHQYTISAPASHTSREVKRQGWYHGPTGPTSTIAEERRVDRMVHPNLANGFGGFPAREQPAAHQQQPLQSSERDSNAGSLRRLEALVAVATSEVAPAH